VKEKTDKTITTGFLENILALLYGVVSLPISAFIFSVFVQWLFCQNLHYWPSWIYLLAFLLSLVTSLVLGVWLIRKRRIGFLVGIVIALYPALIITSIFVGPRQCRQTECSPFRLNNKN